MAESSSRSLSATEDVVRGNHGSTETTSGMGELLALHPVESKDTNNSLVVS